MTVSTKFYPRSFTNIDFDFTTVALEMARASRRIQEARERAEKAEKAETRKSASSSTPRKSLKANAKSPKKSSVCEPILRQVKDADYK
jgi:hypothetical protein